MLKNFMVSRVDYSKKKRMSTVTWKIVSQVIVHATFCKMFSLTFLSPSNTFRKEFSYNFLTTFIASSDDM